METLAALRPSVATEWDLLELKYIHPQDPTAHSIAAVQAPLTKMKFKLNRWLANSTPHINQYFSGPIEALIRHEGLCIERNNILVHR